MCQGPMLDGAVSQNNQSVHATECMHISNITVTLFCANIRSGRGVFDGSGTQCVNLYICTLTTAGTAGA